MKLGYPCLNTQFPQRGSRTFRLASYSSDRLCEAIAANLDGLRAILQYNIGQGLLHFRILSSLIPFASHPICTYPWETDFAGQFRALGQLARQHGLRLSLHPDQFTLLNSPAGQITENSIRELAYQARLLDLMELDATHKIQIHIGGVYGDKPRSLARFVDRYQQLPEAIRRRLVIENDDRQYSLRDCLWVHTVCGTPIVFDVFHHALLNEGEPLADAFRVFSRTWQGGHGSPMVDYSSQEPGARAGTHAATLDDRDFTHFLRKTKAFDFDLMLEMKDKEQSALRALAVARQLGRIR